MEESEGIEKTRVRERITEYFNTKQGYKFLKFGKFKKIKLGGATWLYIVEAEMEQGRDIALVPVSRAFPQGIIILNSEQVASIVRALIDGLGTPF